MTAISRLTRAASETQRVERGENRIPTVWRARVVYIRYTAADCGHQPGVYVTVPNFTQGEIHGPVQVVGDTPAEGDLVVAVAVEGRKNDWIIITSSGVAELEGRLGLVEGRVTDVETGLTDLDSTVGDLSSDLSGLRTAHDALKLAHDVLTGDVTDLAELLDSKHGENANAIGLLETQMEVVDSVVEAHQLGEITWWTGDLPTSGSNRTVQIPDYVPSGIARPGRIEVDVVLEDLRGFQSIWCRPTINGDAPFTSNHDIDPAGETHRFRFQWDIQVPANAAVEVEYAVLDGDGNRGPGRIGITRPQLTSPTVRSV